MPVSLSNIRDLLLPGLWQTMGSMGSSGAIYGSRYKRECFNCGAVSITHLVNGKLLCGPCAGMEALMQPPSGTMPEPAFSLEEIESSQDLITNLSNR